MQQKVLAMVASWLKVFVSICIVLVMNHGSIWGIDWHEFANSAAMSLLPVLYNFVNPNDPRYGVAKNKQIVPKPAAPNDVELINKP